MDPPKPATGHEIQEILGPVDDEVVTNILHTGATGVEVSEAFEWLNDDDYMGKDLKKTMNERVRRVFNILQDDRDRVTQD